METTSQAGCERSSDPYLLAYAQHMSQTAESELARHLFAAYVEQTITFLNTSHAGLPRIQFRDQQAEQTRRTGRA
jgi:hypothetical protein